MFLCIKAKHSSRKAIPRPLPPIPLQTDQLKVISQHVQQQNLKVGIFYSEESDKARAKNIASEMRAPLQGESTTFKVVKVGKKWLKKAGGEVTHYVIVGEISDFESHTSKKQTCQDFLDAIKNDGKSVSEVVFVCKSSNCQANTGFLCLDNSLDSRELGIRALGHFAGKDSKPLSHKFRHSYIRYTVAQVTFIEMCSCLDPGVHR